MASLLYRKGSTWLSYLAVLFELGEQLGSRSINATICYIQPWWFKDYLYLKSQFQICDIQSFTSFQWIQVSNKTNVLDKVFLDPDANVFEMLTS